MDINRFLNDLWLYFLNFTQSWDDTKFGKSTKFGGRVGLKL